MSTEVKGVNKITQNVVTKINDVLLARLAAAEAQVLALQKRCEDKDKEIRELASDKAKYMAMSNAKDERIQDLKEATVVWKETADRAIKSSTTWNA